MSLTVITSDTAKLDFVEYVQDTLAILLGYSDPKGKLIDVTGWFVDMEIRKTTKDPLPILHISTKTGHITLTSGKYNLSIVLSDQETFALGKGEFVYFIRTKDTQGFVNTLADGRIILKER